MIDIKAKTISGVAVKFTTSHPNCAEFAPQFINQPEVIEERATKPKTKKSFIPCNLPRSEG